MCSIENENTDESFPSYEKWINFKDSKTNKFKNRRASSDWNIDTSLGTTDDKIITDITPTSQNSEMLLVSLLDMFIEVYSKENNIDQTNVKERMITLLHKYGFLQNIHYTHYSLDTYKKFLRNFLGTIFSLSPEKLLTIEYSNINDPNTNDVILSRYKYEFEEIGQIGKGGSGRVFKSKHCLDNTVYAIKKISLKHISNVGYILREIQILAKLDHINVIRYFNSWIEIDGENKNTSDTVENETTEDEIDSYSEHSDVPSNNQLIQYLPTINGLDENYNYMLFMQMQLCDYSLDAWLEKRNNNKELMESIKTNKKELNKFYNTGIDIFKQILNGMEYVHSLGIIHRDLKPSNIFICNGNKNFTIKIGDFGLATKELISNKHSNGIGTMIYSSPEQIHSSHYDNRTDIFSLGLILFEILYPMKTSMEKITNFQSLRKGEIPKEAEFYINENIRSILLKMVLKNIDNRISLSNVMLSI